MQAALYGKQETLVLALAPPAGTASSPARAEAMAKLAPMRGVWRGPATGVDRDGQPFTLTQTERIGPLLDGDLLVVEDCGYAESGKVEFNAFGVMSWDETTLSGDSWCEVVDRLASSWRRGLVT